MECHFSGSESRLGGTLFLFQTMQIGISSEEREIFRRIFSSHPSVEAALLFGSRSKGTHRKDSDADIALAGRALSLSELEAIKSELKSSTLSYPCEVSRLSDMPLDMQERLLERAVRLYEARKSA